MIESSTLKTSQTLSTYQRDKVFRVLSKLEELHAIEKEHDLGNTKPKERSIYVPTNKLASWMRAIDIERGLLEKILLLLQEEEVLLDPEESGVMEVSETVLDDNPFLLVFPADFTVRSSKFRHDLMRPPPTVSKPANYSSSYDESIFLSILKVLLIPFTIVFFILKFVLEFILKTIVEIASRAWKFFIIALALALVVGILNLVNPFLPPGLGQQIQDFVGS